MNEIEIFTVELLDKGKRLDVFLSEVTEFSRSHVIKLIEDGLVTISGKIPKKSGEKLAVGDEIRVELVPPKEISLEPEDIPLDVVYEDEDIIVVNEIILIW